MGQGCGPNKGLQQQTSSTIISQRKSAAAIANWLKSQQRTQGTASGYVKGHRSEINGPMFRSHTRSHTLTVHGAVTSINPCEHSQRLRLRSACGSMQTFQLYRINRTHVSPGISARSLALEVALEGGLHQRALQVPLDAQLHDLLGLRPLHLQRGSDSTWQQPRSHLSA